MAFGGLPFDHSRDPGDEANDRYRVRCEHAERLRHALDEVTEDARPSFLSPGRGRRPHSQVQSVRRALDTHKERCWVCSPAKGKR